MSRKAKNFDCQNFKVKFFSLFFNLSLNISKGTLLKTTFRVRFIGELKEYKSIFKARSGFWINLKCRMLDMLTSVLPLDKILVETLMGLRSGCL